jgi:hypothetical protein
VPLRVCLKQQSPPSKQNPWTWKLLQSSPPSISWTTLLSSERTLNFGEFNPESMVDETLSYVFNSWSSKIFSEVESYPQLDYGN